MTQTQRKDRSDIEASLGQSFSIKRLRVPLQRIVTLLRITGAFLAGAAALLGIAPQQASAHGRSVSYSNWEIQEESVLVSVRLKLLELSRLGPDALPPGIVANDSGGRDLPAEFFPRDLVLFADDEPCKADALAKRRPDDPGWVRYEWQIQCPPDAKSLTIATRILLDVAPSHIHFARIHFNKGAESDHVREQILTEASPRISWPVADQASATSPKGSDFLDYLALGVRHILSGWDHLAFVFGLLLLAKSLREVARLITGFTIAHSVTLALAVQGWIVPQAAAVEAVIAFSVALVAVEKGWTETGRGQVIPIVVVTSLAALGIASWGGLTTISTLTILGLMLFTACYFSLAQRNGSADNRINDAWLRTCLTFAFGLVHGFGFAGILVEMTLPTDRLVPALLGFNLGVEIGQIGVVFALWPCLAWGSRLEPKKIGRHLSAFAAAALCGVGVYWLIQRAFSI